MALPSGCVKTPAVCSLGLSLRMTNNGFLKVNNNNAYTIAHAIMYVFETYLLYHLLVKQFPGIVLLQTSLFTVLTTNTSTTQQNSV